jgi:hypothetical protein
MPDPSDIFALHPLPWRIYEGARFTEASPLSIVDADGMAVCAIIGHGPLDHPTSPDDWRVAHAIMSAMRAASEANTKTVGHYKSALHTFNLDPLIDALDGLKHRMGELKTVFAHERAHEERSRGLKD